MVHGCFMQLILVLTSQNFCCTTARRRHVEGVSKLCVEASVLPTEQAAPWPRCDKGKQCVDTTTEDTTVK